MSIEVAWLLDQLGSREWEVARTLDWAGVTGRRRSTSSCPVANFVRLYFPDAFDVAVTPTSVSVWEQRDSMPVISCRLDTPASVRCFLKSFDDGNYPRLDQDLDSFGLKSCREAQVDSLRFAEAPWVNSSLNDPDDRMIEIMRQKDWDAAQRRAGVLKPGP